MTRRTLLHRRIQFLGTTDALQERIVTVPYGVPLHLAPPQSADLTTLQPSIRFGNTSAPSSERCTGKTHMLYLATWHATVVRHGDVAYCMAFDVQCTAAVDPLHTYVLALSRKQPCSENG